MWIRRRAYQASARITIDLHSIWLRNAMYRRHRDELEEEGGQLRRLLGDGLIGRASQQLDDTPLLTVTGGRSHSSTRLLHAIHDVSALFKHAE